MAVSVRALDSDAGLVEAAQHGDADAFGELFRRHYQAVRRSCARRLRNVRDADEVAQAAFVRAFERIDRCQGEKRFGGWVQVIAHNLCVDAQRHRARVAPVESPGDDACGPVAFEPEHVIERSADADLVRLALADLPPRQRDVVVARDLDGRRPGEIAAALGLSLGAVDSLLLRGRRRLASAVTRIGNEGGQSSPVATSSVVAAAAGSTQLTSIVAAVESAVARVSYQVAASLGLVPGLPGAMERTAAAAATAGALALGALAPSSAPAGATAHPVAALPAVPNPGQIHAPVDSKGAVAGGSPVAAPAIASTPVAAVAPLPQAPAAAPTPVAGTVADTVRTVGGLVGAVTDLLGR